MSKHTRGPWQLLPDEPGRGHLRVRGTILGDRWKIADIPKFDQEAFAEETKANARLITAAPQILAALKAVEWEGFDERHGMNRCPSCHGVKPQYIRELSGAVLSGAVLVGHAPGCQLHDALKLAEEG